MDYFSGKVVLITGGARGIGFATATHLGKRGAKIAISDVNETRLEASRKELESLGIDAISTVGDVSVPADCEKMVAAAIDKFGKLDVLFNNAGISMVSRLDECDYEPCRKLIEINALGSIYMTIAAMDAIKASRGHIVFMSSVSGIRAIPTGALYSSSKAAVRSVAESIRIELKPNGVHVGVICPGFTTTDPEKTVMKGDGSPRPIDRPPHDTPEGVAHGVADLIEHRRREVVLTPMGKITSILQRLSPSLLDFILARRELKN